MHFNGVIMGPGVGVLILKGVVLNWTGCCEPITELGMYRFGYTNLANQKRSAVFYHAHVLWDVILVAPSDLI